MKLKKQSGFTLVELLVVIGIIAVLAGVLIGQFWGATESARSAQCQANLRNLAQAVQNYGMSSSRYPMAGSCEYEVLMDDGNGYKEMYGERLGWIAWNSKHAYGSGLVGSTQVQGSWSISLAGSDEDCQYAMTNGTLWASADRSYKTYICPSHLRICSKAGVKPHWSYAMNSYFQYDWGNGSGPTKGSERPGIKYGTLSRPDKLLMFAEIPAVEVGAGSVKLKGGNGETRLDCVLQYNDGTWKKSGGQPEYIGFNHYVGKRHVAHVVFSDSHVGILALPSNASNSELVELTKNLCQGADMSFVNGKWKVSSDAVSEE